jgi:hypothetical protein
MNLTKKLLRATSPISAIGIAMFALPAVAVPINVLDVLQNAPQVEDVQTVQWGDGIQAPSMAPTPSIPANAQTLAPSTAPTTGTMDLVRLEAALRS